MKKPYNIIVELMYMPRAHDPTPQSKVVYTLVKCALVLSEISFISQIVANDQGLLPPLP